MSRTTATIARNRQLLAAAIAFALVSVFVLQASDAAFTVQDQNENNLFMTGELRLEADLEHPMFGDSALGTVQTDAVNLARGDVREACIEIIYTGSFGGEDELTQVQLAVDGGAGANDLVDHLEFEMAQTAACSENPDYVAVGGLTDLAGPTGWTPEAGEETRAFHFRATVQDSAPMNATAGDIDLTWSVSTTTS